MFQLVVALCRRLQRKRVAVAPIIVGALLVAGGLSVVIYAIQPFLPATYRHLLKHARQGAWTARAPQAITSWRARALPPQAPVPSRPTIPPIAPLSALPAPPAQRPVQSCH